MPSRVAWISKPENLWRSKSEWFGAIPASFSGLTHLRIVAEEDGRTPPMLRLVEYDGHRVVDVPAQPHLRAVRALRRAEPTVRKGHPSASADDRTRPLRPDEFPPSVLRDRPICSDSIACSRVTDPATNCLTVSRTWATPNLFAICSFMRGIVPRFSGFDVHIGGRPPWGRSTSSFPLSILPQTIIPLALKPFPVLISTAFRF